MSFLPSTKCTYCSTLSAALPGGVDFDLDRIGQEVAGEIGDRLRHGGREQHGLALLRHHLGDLAQVVHEAEVEHLVGFVEDEIAHGRQADGAAVDEVEQAARRGDEDVGALFKLQLLLVDRRRRRRRR